MFWADKPTELEIGVVDIFGEPPKDDPDRTCVRSQASTRPSTTAYWRTTKGERNSLRLGLAPNAARIAIAFGITAQWRRWQRIRQHFDDLKIVRLIRRSTVLTLIHLRVSRSTPKVTQTKYRQA